MSNHVECASCGKMIEESDYLAHLVDHVSRKYKNRHGVETTQDDNTQIYDLILSRYDDAFDVDVDTILDDFESCRVEKVLEYAPLSIVLYHSDVDGYFSMRNLIHTSLGNDKDEAVASMVMEINEEIDRNLEDGYYNVQIKGSVTRPRSSCCSKSYHMKVPNSWLGLPVVVRKRGDTRTYMIDDGKHVVHLSKGCVGNRSDRDMIMRVATEVELDHIRREGRTCDRCFKKKVTPVVCGNSVHVAIPGAWLGEKITVTLDHVSGSDLMGGEENV